MVKRFFKIYIVILSRYVNDGIVVAATVDECLRQERESGARWNGVVENSTNICFARSGGFVWRGVQAPTRFLQSKSCLASEGCDGTVIGQNGNWLMQWDGYSSSSVGDDVHHNRETCRVRRVLRFLS